MIPQMKLIPDLYCILRSDGGKLSIFSSICNIAESDS
jgi:hypothetical protein